MAERQLSTSLFILPDEVPKERKYLLFVFQIIRVQIRKTIELDFLLPRSHNTRHKERGAPEETRIVMQLEEVS